MSREPDLGEREANLALEMTSKLRSEGECISGCIRECRWGRTVLGESTTCDSPTDEKWPGSCRKFSVACGDFRHKIMRELTKVWGLNAIISHVKKFSCHVLCLRNITLKWEEWIAVGEDWRKGHLLGSLLQSFLWEIMMAYIREITIGM